MKKSKKINSPAETEEPKGIRLKRMIVPRHYYYNKFKRTLLVDLLHNERAFFIMLNNVRWWSIR